MIVYFADRNLNVLGQASTGLPDGLRIVDDLKSEDLESGTTNFECTIFYSSSDTAKIDEMVKPGFFLLRSNEGESEFYTITETERDTFDQSVRIYAEDGGLDLLNRVVPAYEASEAKTAAAYVSLFIPSGWELGVNETSGSKTIKWDGEATLTERLVSIANEFKCDLSYSFEIKQLVITHKYINFHKHRGDDEAKLQLSLNREIKRIVTKKSTANMATALAVTGGTPSGKSTPINLKNYSYSYTDANGDEYKVDAATGQMRNISAMRRCAGVLDSDGLILKRYSYDTTNQATLAGAARAELQKMCCEEVNYEIEFTKLEAKIGDRVFIIDDHSEVYLDARILKLSRSVCSETVSATLGEYVIKSSGITDRLAELAKTLKDTYVATSVLSISSSSGTVFSEGTVITNLSVSITCGSKSIRNVSELHACYGDEVTLVWYENGHRVLSQDPRIDDAGFTFKVSGEFEVGNTKYECRLEG